ncbi:MAG: hypothetical protein QXL94_00560 [Candidatus Parvarchaeum sp.]
MDDDEMITEIDEVDFSKVSGVSNPANGTPFLLLKSASEDGIMEENQSQPEGPESNGMVARETDSYEDMEKMVEDALAKGFCGDPDCEACKEANPGITEFLLGKEKLSSAVRNKLPASSFAYISSTGVRKLPLNNESHVRNALARFNQTQFESHEAKVKAARKIRAKAKHFGISINPKDEVMTIAKSTGVPDVAVQTPKFASVESKGTEFGERGSMTGEVKHHDDPAFAVGGEPSYEIPIENKAFPVANDPAPPPLNRPREGSAVFPAKKLKNKKMKKGKNGLVKGKRKELFPFPSDGLDMAIKENWVTIQDPTPAETALPGNKAWETYDSHTLDAAAQHLSAAAQAVEAIRQREEIEAVSGDAGDVSDARQLGEVADQLTQALQVVAALTYHEATGEHHLSPVAADGIQKTHKLLEKIIKEHKMSTLSQEEFAALVDQRVAKQTKALKKDLKKAAAKLKKAKKASVGRANNGGNVTAAQLKHGVTKTDKASNIDAIPDGGHVDGEYINKGKGKSMKKSKRLEKNLANLESAIQNLQSQARGGGPSLIGSPVAPVSGSLAKEMPVGDISDLVHEIDELTAQRPLMKSLEEKSRLEESITHKRLALLALGAVYPNK